MHTFTHSTDCVLLTRACQRQRGIIIAIIWKCSPHIHKHPCNKSTLRKSWWCDHKRYDFYLTPFTIVETRVFVREKYSVFSLDFSSILAIHSTEKYGRAYYLCVCIYVYTFYERPTFRFQKCNSFETYDAKVMQYAPIMLADGADRANDWIIIEKRM